MPHPFIVRPLVKRDWRTAEKGDRLKPQRSRSARGAYSFFAGMHPGIKEAAGTTTMAVVEGYNIRISKVFVENLSSSGPAGWRTRMFKVTFSAGTEKVETHPKYQTTSGSIQWTDSLEMSVNAEDDSIVATVVARDSITGPWTLVTGCRFDASPATACCLVWQHPSDPPGSGPNICVELETCVQEDRGNGDSGPSPTFGTETRKGVPCYPSATGGTGVEQAPTASTVRHDFASTAWERRTIEGVKPIARFDVFVADQAQARDATDTRAASFRSYFVEKPSSFMRDGARSAESHDSIFSMTPSTEGIESDIRQRADCRAQSTVLRPLEVQFAASTESETISTAVVRDFIGGFPFNPLKSVTRKQSGTSSISGSPSYSTIETQQVAMDGSGVTLPYAPWKEGHTKRGTGDAIRVSNGTELTLTERFLKFARAKHNAPLSPSKDLFPRRGTDPLSPPSPRHDNPVLPVRTTTQPRSVDVPHQPVDGKSPCSPSLSLLPPRLSKTANKGSPPLPFDEQASLDTPVADVSAPSRALPEKESALQRKPPFDDHPHALWTGVTMIPAHITAQNAAREPNTVGDRPSAPEEDLACHGPGAPTSPRSTAKSGSLSPTRSVSTLGSTEAQHQRWEALPEKESALQIERHFDDHPDALWTQFTTIPAHITTHNAARETNTVGDRRSDPEEDLASHVDPCAPTPPRSTAESGSLSPTSTASTLGRRATRDIANPVYIVSISPPLVCTGCHFNLRVSAYMGRVRGEGVGDASGDAEVEARVLGAMLISRAERVAVEMEFPEHVFKVLGPFMYGPSKDARRPADEKELTENEPNTMSPIMHDSDYASPRSPSVQDMVRNGKVQDTTFRVECLPGAPVGVVQCSVCITEGSIVTRLSFGIEVAESEPSGGCDEMAAVVELDTSFEKVRTDAAVLGRNVPTTAENALGRGIRVSPPAPVMLASRVDPGPGVLESKEHGFRLTVPDGSLHGAIGPITVQECAQVVKCKDDGQDYLVKAVADCQPSGIEFPEIPLFMDFLLKGCPPANISQSFEVFVRKDEAGGWRKVDSKLRVDEWGTYLRAEVTDFCLFTCGSKLHPGDPARLEDCSEESMIEVQNATGVELFFVLVPVLFDSDRTCRVTYTGNIGFGTAGVTVQAGGSSDHERAEKSHMLPAGFTPDDVSVAPGGKFYFCPPPKSKEGKLLVAAISEESQAGLTVKVVVLHGKFNTPTGKRRVILPIFLQGKSRISARLGPDDVPVEMVMIMAGLGSKTASPTVALSPEDSMRMSANASAASRPTPPVVSPAAPHPVTHSRRGSMKRCTIS